VTNPIKCPLCRGPATFRPINADLKRVECPRCGTYDVTGSGESVLDARPIQNVGAVSGWVRHQNAMGLTPSLDSKNVDPLRALTKPSFQERAERVLIAAAQKAPRLDQRFNPGTPDFVGVSYSDDTNELVIILEHLREEDFLTKTRSDQTGERLTAKGYIAADELRARRAASTQAFVAMQFTDDMTLYDKGLRKGVEDAGFEPMLISRKEHANKIDDEIIAEIRRSAFIVADFTGHRQNVYFECGFAIGLGSPVIWTCRKDEIKHLHFDIRQYNCLDWQNEADLALRLTRRIEAMFGHGPLSRP
jgi:nucleoside 2-deoxyribosyltransferase